MAYVARAFCGPGTFLMLPVQPPSSWLLDYIHRYPRPGAWRIHEWEGLGAAGAAGRRGSGRCKALGLGPVFAQSPRDVMTEPSASDM